MGWLVVAMFVGAILEMVGIGAIPAFVRLLVDPPRLLALLPANGISNVVRSMDLATLTLTGAACLVILYLAKNLFSAGLVYSSTRLIQDVRADVGQRLFHAYLYNPYTFHLQRNPAQLVSTIQGEVNRTMVLLESALRLAREGLVLVLVFGLLGLIDPWVCVWVFGLLATASGIFYFIVRRSLRRRGKQIQKHWGRVTQVMNQALGAIKEAKILGREAHFEGKFAAEVRGIRRHEAFQQVIGALPRLFLEVMAVTAVLIVVAVFVWLGRPIQSLLPVLALLAIASVRLVPSLSLINSAISSVRYNQAALDLVCAELDTLEASPPESPNPRDAENGARHRPNTLGLQGVHYRYPEAAGEALSGVSLEIKAGEVVAFVGPSGAGKSTLVDVMLGLLPPTRGEVRVDGRDVRSDVGAWQRQIGYVPQEIYLIDDTIRRNIAFGLADDTIDEVAVARAVAAAQLDTFVQTLPAGLDTVIGNWGVRISGGQRQRIGIARALYHNPGVLILDEATSSLDNETERDVIAAITRQRGDRTIIMIAHRLTTVQDCDRLYLLENGRVMDHGSFADLLSRHLKLAHVETAGAARGGVR